MRSATILTVDDDPISLTVASLVLRQAGFTVQTAADGKEALDLLQTLQPDLILSDIQMPNMDGFELARRTRQISRLRDIPMIALTAFATKEAELRAYDAGFTAYMTKPINCGALAARIRRFLEYPVSPRRLPAPGNAGPGSCLGPLPRPSSFFFAPAPSGANPAWSKLDLSFLRFRMEERHQPYRFRPARYLAGQ